jgi:hypothetical protein
LNFEETSLQVESSRSDRSASPDSIEGQASRLPPTYGHDYPSSPEECHYDRSFDSERNFRSPRGFRSTSSSRPRSSSNQYRSSTRSCSPKPYHRRSPSPRPSRHKMKTRRFKRRKQNLKTQDKEARAILQGNGEHIQAD